MNTIRKARKRPRVRSVNFKTLGWLIRREAAWRILTHYTGHDTPPELERGRPIFAERTTRSIDAEARRRLSYDPATRQYL